MTSDDGSDNVNSMTARTRTHMHVGGHDDVMFVSHHAYGAMVVVVVVVVMVMVSGRVAHRRLHVLIFT